MNVTVSFAYLIPGMPCERREARRRDRVQAGLERLGDLHDLRLRQIPHRARGLLLHLGVHGVDVPQLDRRRARRLLRDDELEPRQASRSFCEPVITGDEDQRTSTRPHE